jgi:NAD(P)H-hydrate repair Nnr-like enzyme with NAD(P)H-hydrate dehydratase domain
VATAQSIAPFVALALPEARVFGLPEIGPAGDIAPEAADEIAERAQKNDAVLLGPGMVDEESAAVFVTRLAACLSEAGSKTTLVLDAAALSTLKNAPDVLHRLNGRVILTPHAGEAAGLLGDDKEKVTARPAETATRAARELRAVFALKGHDHLYHGAECGRHTLPKRGRQRRPGDLWVRRHARRHRCRASRARGIRASGRRVGRLPPCEGR